MKSQGKSSFPAATQLRTVDGSYCQLSSTRNCTDGICGGGLTIAGCTTSARRRKKGRKKDSPAEYPTTEVARSPPQPFAVQQDLVSPVE
jgi:hypothetical protein